MITDDPRIGLTHTTLDRRSAVMYLALQSDAVSAAFVRDCSDTTTTRIPQIECEALKDLYNATDGDNWTMN